MKKNLTLAITYFAFLTSAFPQEKIVSTLGAGWFLQGASPIMNTFKILVSAPTNATYCKFLLYSKNNSIIDSIIDTNIVEETSAIFDMGKCSEGSYVDASYFNDGNDVVEECERLNLNILPTPSWMAKNNGKIENAQFDTYNRAIVFSAKFNMPNTETRIDNGVVGLGGKPIATGANFEFNASFDITTRKFIVSKAVLTPYINYLQQEKFEREYTVSNELSINSDFEISLTIELPNVSKNISFETPEMPIAAFPGIKAYVKAGLSLGIGVNGRVIYGSNLNEFGFIENLNKQRTSINATATITGNLTGGISVAFGLARVEGILTAEGNLGVGLNYINIPSEQANFINGGNFSVKGKLTAKIGRGIFSYRMQSGEKTFYSGFFGDQSVFPVKSITALRLASKELPIEFPSPNLSASNNFVGTVWLENDGNSTALLFSKYGLGGNKFSATITVQKNSNSINNPKLSMYEDGSALICWSQNRYLFAEQNETIDMMEFLKAQDIWYAYYDANQDKITTIAAIPDDNSGKESGRSDGEAKISVGKTKSGIISWTGMAKNENNTDTYYSFLKLDGQNWSASVPEKISDLSGNNFAANIVYEYESDSAVAIWINDEDANDSTTNTRIVFSEWNGKSWSPSSDLVKAKNDILHTEITTDFAMNFGAVGILSKKYKPNGESINYFSIDIYDESKDDFITEKHFEDFDSLYFFQKPNISINNDGIAVATYQAINKFDITADYTYMYLNNLSLTKDWQEVKQSEIIQDTNMHVWDATSALDKNGNLYFLTQESTYDLTVANVPKNGLVFGDPTLGLVFRGLKINSNLTFDNIQEPETPNGVEKTFNSFQGMLFQNSPNPFSYFTNINFLVRKNSHVKLEIQDLVGKPIKVILEENLQIGDYQTTFIPENLTNGVYLYKLTIDGQSVTKKMVLVN